MVSQFRYFIKDGGRRHGICLADFLGIMLCLDIPFVFCSFVFGDVTFRENPIFHVFSHFPPQKWEEKKSGHDVKSSECKKILTM